MLQQLSAVGAVVHDLFGGQFVHGRAVQIVCQLCTACGQCVVQLAALHIAQDLAAQVVQRGNAQRVYTHHQEQGGAVDLHSSGFAVGKAAQSIGCWVPFNEGWGQFDAAGAVQAIRTLDDTRLVDEASGWYDQGGGDVCSIHNYFYPLHVKPGSRTVALSEYGGIAWPMPGHEAPGKTYGYGTAKSRADLTARCKKLQLGTVLPQLKKGLSALVYTQLTDVEDEVNGLFTYDRAEIKPDANAVRSVNAALAAEFAKVTR